MSRLSLSFSRLGKVAFKVKAQHISARPVRTATAYESHLGTDLNSEASFTSPSVYFAPNGYGLFDMAGNVFESHLGRCPRFL